MVIDATAPCAIIPPRVIGCDVGKNAVTVLDTLTGQTTELANQPEALTAFVHGLPTDCLVVCEATGGYEAVLLFAADAAGVPIHRADARKVKAFIRSLGRLGKTDAIDARGLARYGQERHAELPRWQPARGVLDELRTLTRLRTQLVKQRAALTNQLKAPGGEIAKQRLQTLRAAATEQITAIEADLRQLIDRDPAVAEVVAIIEAIPGCGRVTAVTVVALMPELGTMTARQAASLAGLAPHPHQSGQAIAAPAADDPRSNAPCSWPPWPRETTTPPSRPSTSDWSPTAKNPSSLSPRSCESSLPSSTPASETPTANPR